MQTRCPECRTAFRVTEQQLGVAGGRVRCGECMTVFDARANAVAPAPPPPPARSAPEEDEDHRDVGALLREWRTEERPVPPPAGRSESPFESVLHRRPEPAEAPKPVEPSKPAEPPKPAAEAARPAAEASRKPAEPRRAPAELPRPVGESRSAGPAVDLRSARAALFPEADDGLPAALARREGSDDRVMPTVGWTVGSLVLVLLFGFQFVYFHRLELAEKPALRPWIEGMCAVLNCRLPLPRLPAQVTMLRKDVRSHATQPNALVITGELENSAGVAQVYPEVEFTFRDLHGAVVASRRFRPAEYLLAGDDGTFEAGERVMLRLEVVDPGREALGFEFSFH